MTTVADDGVVVVRDVSKAFGGTPVIEDIALSVRPGEMFGLIGPSGCGKTTLVRLLVGLLKPTAGRLRVHGKDPARFSPSDREAIGYSPQDFFLYPTLTVRGNTLFVAGLYGLGWLRRRRRAKELLTFLGLWEARDRRTSHLSGGMRRRLLLACALLHEPQLLVVDEPTAGLDPALRHHIWEHLNELRAAGVTIFLTTQYLDEAEYCDRVAVMNEGRIVAIGSPAELRRQAMHGDIVVVVAPGISRDDIGMLMGLEQVRRVQRLSGDELELLVDDSGEAIADITRTLHAQGREVESVRAQPASFDDVFLALVRRSVNPT